VLSFVRGEMSLEDTKREIRKSTRTYARRQRTWFKGEPGVSWFSESARLLEQGGRARIARELGL
jgi:tRNA A37 N6-isopentenylltransferase MiaA